jgi:hypothetical protein
MKEPWQKLRVGDRIRFVHMPTAFSREGYQLHRDTRQAYKKLIERGRAGRSVRVSKIDEWKMPWVSFQLRRKDGRIEYHSMLINHDGWVLVKHRRSPR